MEDTDNCTFCRLVSDESEPTRIVEMAHSVAFVNLEQTYRGRSIVVLKEHYGELLEVPEELFDAVNAEMREMAAAIQAACRPDRLNFAILGNVEAHVHWHVIPRYQNDPNWGAPPWPIANRVRLPGRTYQELARLIRSYLPSHRSGVRQKQAGTAMPVSGE